MSAQGTLDDRYLGWLYSRVGAARNRNPARSHWNLLNQLYRKPYSWTILNDSNRARDGVDLREEFLQEFEIDRDELWLELDCSFLEMLMALSERASFLDDGSALGWFWKLMENIELDKYTDEVYNDHIAEEVEQALDRVIQRTYSRDGTGGLFPLRYAKTDQRRVELWYQLNAYLLEGRYAD